MRKIKVLIPLTVMLFVLHPTAKSQVLISLLLGDKLNSDKLEFGLDGGANLLNMTNTPGSKAMVNWNLGFYFDFKMNEKLFIHTGVIVKSKMGTASLEPYSLNNNELDTLFTGGIVDRKINYFNVPVLLRYRFVDYVHVEGGIQLGLRYTGYDIFTQSINNSDLEFRNDVKDNFQRLDAGGVIGIGYKLKKGKGMTLSARYYYGFVDANKLTNGAQHNTASYFNVSIPIGKGKAEKKAAENEPEVPR
ncbi:MAG TPA: porin family protein [Chitinophagales bacterium]|nr:porin family protein [Chitinophagales bacterium]